MPQSKIRRYLRHGTLPQLSVFEAVARLGSFTRAAEELYMAQPTVSVQIKKLTETIGLPVLEQVGKTVRLTPVGRELQTVCSEIFATLTRFEQRVADLLIRRTSQTHVERVDLALLNVGCFSRHRYASIIQRPLRGDASRGGSLGLRPPT